MIFQAQEQHWDKVDHAGQRVIEGSGWTADVSSPFRLFVCIRTESLVIMAPSPRAPYPEARDTTAVGILRRSLRERESTCGRSPDTASWGGALPSFYECDDPRRGGACPRELERKEADLEASHRNAARFVNCCTMNTSRSRPAK